MTVCGAVRHHIDPGIVFVKISEKSALLSFWVVNLGVSWLLRISTLWSRPSWQGEISARGI